MTVLVDLPSCGCQVLPCSPNKTSGSKERQKSHPKRHQPRTALTCTVIRLILPSSPTGSTSCYKRWEWLTPSLSCLLVGTTYCITESSVMQMVLTVGPNMSLVAVSSWSGILNSTENETWLSKGWMREVTPEHLTLICPIMKTGCNFPHIFVNSTYTKIYWMVPLYTPPGVPTSSLVFTSGLKSETNNTQERYKREEALLIFINISTLCLTTSHVSTHIIFLFSLVNQTSLLNHTWGLWAFLTCSPLTC